MAGPDRLNICGKIGKEGLGILDWFEVVLIEFFGGFLTTEPAGNCQGESED